MDLGELDEFALASLRREAAAGVLPMDTTLTARHRGKEESHGGQGCAVTEQALPKRS
ncbi:hypothetical protein [Streptomyces sp. NPDC019937]|uniref:hypothetical protein n=1 Tax=Streptomyces sp. NPDC019937 TaxID=3154787 RepID=UPI003402BE1B